VGNPPSVSLSEKTQALRECFWTGQTASAAAKDRVWPASRRHRIHVRAKLTEQLSIQPVAVITFVADQLLGHTSNEPRSQSLRDQFHFSRASTLCAYGERKIMTVCNRDELADARETEQQ
jgi:hypothetical protein